jgi:Ca2+-binding RTX toxin-like protein
MQREPALVRKIADNKAKTINPIIATAPVITATTSLLQSSPVVGVGKVWADNFFGTSGPDIIVGTDDDDKIFGWEGNDNLSGEGGDDYIEGNAGDDEINDGLGSDKIRAGSGDDTIKVEEISEEDGMHHDRDDVDIVYVGKGKDNYC